LQQRAVIAFDGAFLPLAVADLALMLRFERDFAEIGRPTAIPMTLHAVGGWGCARVQGLRLFPV
jgi:hypothetical protein